MKKTLKHLFLLVFIGLYSCNTTKFVPNNHFLINKVKIKTDEKNIETKELKKYVQQIPNSKVLGLVKMQLGIYNLSGKDSTSFFNKWLRSIGSPPVIYNPNLTKISREQIAKFCFNKGYMNAKVTSKEKYINPKKVDVIYNITYGKPYKISSYDIEIENKKLLLIASDSTKSKIEIGKLFDVTRLDSERDRITRSFRNLGYYHFTKDNLHFYADTSFQNNSVKLVLKVIGKEEDSKVFQEYKFKNIYFINKSHFVSQKTEKNTIDSLKIGNFNFYYKNEKYIRPSTLIQKTHILPNHLFSDKAIKKTYSSLNGLSAIGFIDIKIEELENNELNTIITLSQTKSQSISTDVEGTYSAGYLGIGGNINFNHKNIFNGSELLSIGARTSYEYQGEGKNAYELGAEAKLKFPTALIPFISKDKKKEINANTEISINYNYQNRPKEYTGIITGATFKYRWNENFNFKHSFDLLNINYVNYPYISNEYRDYLKTSPYFVYNFQNHLIINIGYKGSYTGFSKFYPLRDYMTMSYSLETAGNLIHSFNNLLKTSKNSSGFYEILGTQYAQYVKVDYNVTKHQILDKNNQIVFHGRLGVALPYGNSLTVPFEKRYFSGGANSVRGWTAYQLGPGTFDNKKRYIDYNTQMGDIKIDINMEYRTKLFWLLEGALFLDAGNVWTIKKYNIQSGGEFKFNKFFKQLGVAYGAGLRMDFSFVIVRFDLGVKLYDPKADRLHQWRTHFNKDDFALNIAVGYPF